VIFCSVVSAGTLVFSTNKTDCHDIAEILLKVALNTITLTLYKSVSLALLLLNEEINARKVGIHVYYIVNKIKSCISSYYF
jgi:hypothetical protein